MGSFATLAAQLRLNISDFTQQLDRAAQAARRFGDRTRATLNEGLLEPAQKSKFAFKDVARIVQGIVIAKVFYSGLNAIRNCVDAVWEFSQALEYAQIAYSNFFGDTALAEEFINVLKDFAAKTPFTFEDAEKSAKRLIAYGIQYKNVMYVMQGVMSAASMQGDPAKIESISRALGQIYTKGRLMGDEMKQLTEAGIPAWEILQEKLHLTKEQLGSIADVGIPASDAINALVDGMNERFGDVVKASSTTIRGIISNIKDNATMLGASIVEPLIGKIKIFLNFIGKGLFNLREIAETLGSGGVFEAIIPQEVQGMVRQFIANIQNLHHAIVNLVVALSGLLSPVMQAIMTLFNALAPIVSLVANLLAAIIGVITSNATAMNILAQVLAFAAMMWVLFKVKALAALVVTKVCAAISKAISFISTALTFVMAHPFWTLLFTLIALVVGLSGGFNSLGESVRGFFASLNKAMGYDPDKVLMPSQKERANDLNKFNKALEKTGDNMDDLADSTGKATKAAKGLLSFDEVFKLNNPDEGAAATPPSYTPDIDLGDLGADGFGVDDIKIPDFTGFADKFVKKLKKALKNALANGGLDMLIGGTLGSIIGGIFGGPAGALIGGAIGTLVGWIWHKIAEAFGMSPEEEISTLLGTGIGAAIGGIMGGPGGAIIGGAIGTFVGWLIGQIIHGIETGEWDTKAISMAIGGVFGAAIGAIMGGPAGALIGGAIGTFGGWLINKIAEGMATGDWDTGAISTGIGTAIGSAIGVIVGGPIGALIGAPIGALCGWIWDKIAEALGMSPEEEIGTLIGAGIGGGIGFIAGGPAGAAIGTAIGGLVGWIFSLIGEKVGGALAKLTDYSFDEIIEGLKEWFIEGIKSIFSYDWTKEIFKWAGEFFDEAAESFKNQDWAGLALNIVKGIGAGLLGAITAIFEPISRFFEGVWDGFCDVFGIHSPAKEMEPIGENILLGVLEGILGAVTAVIEAIGVIAAEIIEAFAGWFVDLGSKVTEWFSGAGTAITTWASDAGTAIVSWASDTWTSITTWCSDTFNAIGSWVTNTAASFTGWVTDTAANIAGWVTDTAANIAGWVTDTAANIAGWVTDTVSSFTSWVSDTASKITNWVTDTSNKVSNWVTNNASKISNWVTDTANKIANWATNTASKISKWVTDTVKGISSWASSVGSKIASWASSAGRTISGWASSAKSTISNWWTKTKGWFSEFKSTSFTDMCSRTLSTITNWCSNLWDTISDFFGRMISKIGEFLGLSDSASDKVSDIESSGSSSTSSTSKTRKLGGHATGGIFNREHIARFAEGNKSEAIIPLEEKSAMQPFVDAVANGLTASLGPMLANISAGNSSPENNLQPLYVGTLIADDRSLKELERRMNVIRMHEERRR